MGGSRPPHGRLREEDQTVKSVTFAKTIKTVELVAPTKNIVSVPIEFFSTSISNTVNSVCDSIPVESDLVKSIESIENSFPYNMISDSTYLLALNVFIFEIWVWK